MNGEDKMSGLRFRLLGGLTLSWDEQPLPPIRGATARSLLAYLATYRTQAHTRDLLAGTFWPDLPDAVARRRLSQAVWQIRKALDPHPVLLPEGDAIQINPDLPLWLDVEQFTAHRAQCMEGGPQALDHCARCVEHYHGDFLAGYYDDWVLPEREQLREAFLGTLERLVDGLKAQGDYEEALAHARRLVTEDPLHEEAHREVMRLCHLLGRDNEALQQWHLCREILAEELAAEPSAETTALADEIARRAAEGEMPHLPVASRPLSLLDRPDQVPLVGRRVERAELARHLELASSGRGGLVFLVGGAGVGKTRLMQEVARDAAWRGFGVSWGHSCELCAPPPYQPLVEMLHDADLSHLTEVWRRELGRLLPDLGPPPPHAEPEQEKGRLLEALARAFLALGQGAPHLLILEDVHWMESASFEALRVLLPRLPASRLLVVASFRPEELVGQPAAQQSLAALEATRIPQRLELEPLTLTETETLVRQVLGMRQAAPLFSQRLYNGTEGNPFFLTETLRTLVDEGLLQRDEAGEWSTPWDGGTDNYAGLPVPPSITQGIERRLAHLPSAVQDLLGVAAVIGRQVEFDLWLAAGECDEGTTLAAAEDLTERGLLTEVEAGVSSADGGDLLGYRFVHDTIRQVVYDNLSPVRRRLWHRRVAAALEALHREEVEALAHHYHLGQNWSQALHYALRAGERAQTVYANQQALDHYGRADAWLAQGRATWPADQVARWQADLAERQGRVHNLVGNYEAAEAAFARARRAWAGLGDWRSEARVLNRLSFWRFVQGDCVGASHYADTALGVVEGSSDTGSVGLRATSLTYLGLCAWTEGRYEDALPPLQQALADFEEIGTDAFGLARCLNSLGLVHLELGDLSLAEDCFARSLALRQQIGDRRGEAWCWHNQGRAALARGDLAAARENLEAAQAIFAEIEHPNGLESCVRMLAEVECNEAASRQAHQIPVRLPSADAPTGRPLRDDEYVTVTWTLSTPEEETMTRKVERRQHRLLRLLQEANEQGAAPTVDDLATVLEVSPGTIKRDLAVLRRAGHAVQTRGSREG
jgi:DNA-binding SARP family transcriptional activator